MYIFQKRLKKRISSRKYKYFSLSNENKGMFYISKNLVKEQPQNKIEVEELDLTPLKRTSSNKMPSTKGVTKRASSVRSAKMRVNLSRRTVSKIAEAPQILQQVDEESE